MRSGRGERPEDHSNADIKNTDYNENEGTGRLSDSGVAGDAGIHKPGQRRRDLRAANTDKQYNYTHGALAVSGSF